MRLIGSHWKDWQVGCIVVQEMVANSRCGWKIAKADGSVRLSGNMRNADQQMNTKSSTSRKGPRTRVSQGCTLRSRMARSVLLRSAFVPLAPLTVQEFGICVQPVTYPGFDWQFMPKVDGRAVAGLALNRYRIDKTKISTFYDMVAGSACERKLTFNKLVS